jgi:ABC-type Zn uptake system ZnuABC Zn-binding protein ZnuA
MVVRLYRVFLALVAAACSAEAEPRVLTTFLPLTAHALAIAGEDATVEQLLPGGVGAHDYELKPSDARRVAEADLIIINGLGLEDWLAPLLAKASRPETTLVDTSAGLALLDHAEEMRWTDAEKAAGHLGHACPSCHESHAEGRNPHIWLDPVIARHQARIIAEALQKADPANATKYALRLEQYDAQLIDLTNRMADGLRTLRGKNLVTFHDAFPYFARRFGLNYVGVLERFPGREPSPSELGALLETIRSRSIEVIFTERGYSPHLLQSVANQTQSRIAQLDTLEVGAPSADAYLRGMESNLTSLVAAWGNSGGG